MIINIPEELSGTIIEMVAKRKGQMTNMNTHNGLTTLEFEIPTR